jgi:hypothetical protein
LVSRTSSIPKRRRKQLDRGRLEGRHPHHSRHRLRDRGDIRLGRFDACQQALGVLGEHASGLGQPHVPSRAFEQRHARLALELGELLRNRRRTDAGSRSGRSSQHRKPGSCGQILGTLS